MQTYPSAGAGGNAHDPADLRYPSFGTKNEKRLYNFNHPRNMQAHQLHVEESLRQQFVRARGRGMLGIDAEEKNTLEFVTDTNDQSRRLSPF